MKLVLQADDSKRTFRAFSLGSSMLYDQTVNLKFRWWPAACIHATSELSVAGAVQSADALAGIPLIVCDSFHKIQAHQILCFGTGGG